MFNNDGELQWLALIIISCMALGVLSHSFDKWVEAEYACEQRNK